MENYLEVHLMEEDYNKEEDHLTDTYLGDYHMVHLLDFTNGQHLIQKCSCHHGTHKLLFDLNQLVSYHIRNFNIQHT